MDLDPSVLPEVVEGLQVLAAGGSGPAQAAARELLNQAQFGTDIQQVSQSNNTFILPHAAPQLPISPAKSNQQNQVFIQGNQLVSMPLTTSTTPSASSVASTSNQHQVAIGNGNNANAFLAPGTILQSRGLQGTSVNDVVQPTTPTRIVIQTNKRPQTETSTVNPARSGHYVIQVGKSVSNNQNTSTVDSMNKNHIVIRSGSSNSSPLSQMVKQEPAASSNMGPGVSNLLATTSKGVYKVRINQTFQLEVALFMLKFFDIIY